MKATEGSAFLTYDMEDVSVWCDGTWCYRYELHEMNHMSDDYITISFGTPEYDEFFKRLESKDDK